MAKRASKAKVNQIDRLTDWEWITLVAAWRYYENRMTITSATFPEDIIKRFFQGAYSTRVCEQIARQFAETDHGTRGEEDWTKDKYLHDCDKLEWTKFFRFCQGYVGGFHKVVLEIDDFREEVDAFHVDWNDRWYPAEEYCECPHREIYCIPDFIVSIDGEPYEWKGEVK